MDGDNAKGTCTIEVRIIWEGQSIIGSGFYADISRRENGRWKFVERHAQFYHFVPISKGLGVTVLKKTWSRESIASARQVGVGFGDSGSREKTIHAAAIEVAANDLAARG